MINYSLPANLYILSSHPSPGIIFSNNKLILYKLLKIIFSPSIQSPNEKYDA